MKINILLSTAFVLLIAGCATNQSVHDAWVGQPVSALESHPEFGVPSQKDTLSDGSIAYVYVNSGPVNTSVKGFGYGQHLESTQSQCKRTFIVKNMTVADLRVQGHCGGHKNMMP